jgi:tryptophan 2,3-dioxygenase
MANQYAAYLRLEELLGLQTTVGPAEGRHKLGEHFFIIAHQASELWLKALVAELEACEEVLLLAEPLTEGSQQHARRALASALMLEASVQSLQSLDANEFFAFRGQLGSASGAQSAQFARLRDLVGLGIPSGGPIERALRIVLEPGYTRDPSGMVQGRISAELRSLIFTLRDISSSLWRWGIYHLDVVQRTIGRRTGTAGSTGASYLANLVLARPFPTLWDPRWDQPPSSSLGLQAAASGVAE